MAHGITALPGPAIPSLQCLRPDSGQDAAPSRSAPVDSGPVRSTRSRTRPRRSFRKWNRKTLPGPARSQEMSKVRVLVGTRKGAFVLESDGKRERWSITGPHFAGWEVYHMKASPADPNRIYASQSSGWFGQLIQRSKDGGKTWEPVGNQFSYAGDPGTHLWYDGTPHPWEFKRVWHLEPSLTDPDTVYAGVEDAAMFRTTDGGQTWHEQTGLRGHGAGKYWQPGAGGMGLHTILIDPSN